MSETEAGAGDRPAVSERGELALDLGGETLTLRPSFEAIEGFEAATGSGLLALSRMALRGELTLGQTAQIACECIRAWGRETDNVSAKGAGARKVAMLILDGPGLYDAQTTISAMLALATTGGYTSSGKLKPAAATTTGTTTPPGTDAG